MVMTRPLVYPRLVVLHSLPINVGPNQICDVLPMASLNQQVVETSVEMLRLIDNECLENCRHGKAAERNVHLSLSLTLFS